VEFAGKQHTDITVANDEPVEKTSDNSNSEDAKVNHYQKLFRYANAEVKHQMQLPDHYQRSQRTVNVNRLNLLDNLTPYALYISGENTVQWAIFWSAEYYTALFGSWSHSYGCW